MDGDSLFVERVPRIVDFPKVGLMCFVLLICTLTRELTYHFEKDAPIPRAVQPLELGRVVELREVGGLHDRYERRAA